MQLFIGGACAGKRDTVSERFPVARWHRLEPGTPLEGWRETAISGEPLVVTGWAGWIEAALATRTDDGLRREWEQTLDAFADAERERAVEVVVILPEMGRGIVPMAVEERRLRDLTGWLAQDVAERSEAVWYVRHGLVQRLRQVKPGADAR
ncbi:bifunctional adenosylcobinamide kinase/adenosylcobinamide-phosphate guanylyltransferase [Halomonas sp. LBP4]|uniref:bifunctional adenosylcobinamide kinase/adenosylcobinamide-phosphate guanylyltransferase n=1 Tax=Halomonas sp. LBP4 TaxID=2044917 RepID=UPI000D765C06|nr:bifunctional adenosylcobinamide kinase/adenosylcobinamide-phosphate guanylyltransferase [Halomonas sp. LBP4]PXX99663.1 adenosylcobinamide kinase [Halomonas sp. LBP4]